MKIQAHYQFTEQYIDHYGHDVTDTIAANQIGASLGKELLKFTPVNKKKKEYSNIFLYSSTCHIISEENFTDIMNKLRYLKNFHPATCSDRITIKTMIDAIVNKLNK